MQITECYYRRFCYYFWFRCYVDVLVWCDGGERVVVVMWVWQIIIVVDDESMIDGTDDNRVKHSMNPKMTMIMT